MQKHLWLGTAVAALMALSAPSHAQYVEYRSSDKPSVEVNLDALNERQEQEYHAQTDVTQEPLGERRHPRVRYVRPPDVAPAPAPAPVPVRAPEPVYRQEAYEAPQPRAKRRLLKPVISARPAPEQTPEPEYAQEQAPVVHHVENGEMPQRAPIVRRSAIMPVDDDGMAAAPELTPEEIEHAVAQEPVKAAPVVRAAPEPNTVAAPLPRRKPEGVKKSWSVVDGTPEPEGIARAPEGKKAEAPAPVVESAPQPEPEIAAAPAPEPKPMPEPEVVAAPEPVGPAPAPEPIVSRKPVEQVAAAEPAVTQYYGVPQNAIISKKPKLSSELPSGYTPPVYTPPAAQPAPEPVMSPAPVAPVVTAPVVSQPPAPLPTRAPKHEPAKAPEPELAANPLPEVIAPVATPEPEVTPAPETQVAVTPETAPAPQDPAASLPVVPTIGDLTLEFAGSSSDLTAASQQKLDNVVRQMAESIEGRLQVRGYAAGEDGSQSSARRIALSRALSVRSYLMDKGIKPTRVDVRALGTETERTPVDRVDLIFAR